MYEFLKKARIHPEETFSSVLFRLLTFQDDVIMLSGKVQEMLFRREFILYPELSKHDETLAAEKVVIWLLSCSNSKYARGYRENQKMSPTEITTDAKRKLEALEQIDGVIEIEGDLYFIEMKWWEDPIGVPEIAQHLMRVFLRAESRAIIISASGFTGPAVNTCKDALQQKVVILCTLQEFVTLLEKEYDLCEFIKKKVQAAISNRKPFVELPI